MEGMHPQRVTSIERDTGSPAFGSGVDFCAHLRHSNIEGASMRAPVEPDNHDGKEKKAQHERFEGCITIAYQADLP